MSPREKKLLVFFAAGGFLVLNFILYSWYTNLSAAKSAEVLDARLAVETAEALQASSELVADQMEWLAEHEPEPAAYQEAQTTLQEFVEQQARSTGLNIRTQRPLPVDDTGAHYHRARIQIEVTGREQALYQWFDRIKMPQEFRAATRIVLRPNREDDTLIDCRAEIEQWFIPAETGT